MTPYSIGSVLYFPVNAPKDINVGLLPGFNVLKYNETVESRYTLCDFNKLRIIASHAVQHGCNKTGYDEGPHNENAS